MIRLVLLVLAIVGAVTVYNWFSGSEDVPAFFQSSFLIDHALIHRS